MISMLFSMFAVLVTWAALLVVLCGIGVGVQRLFGLKSFDTSRILLSPWNGYAIVILFLQLWHFVLPIQWPALLVTAVAACAGAQNR